MYSDVIRFWHCGESNRHDVRLPEQLGFCDAVHPIHHSALWTQNNGIGEIGGIDQLHMLDHISAGRLCSIMREPEDLIQFGDI